MAESGLRVHELKAGKEVESVQFPPEISKDTPLDVMVLKTVKRNSDTSIYIAVLSSWSIQVCELLLSQATMQYKIIHIKEIVLSVKLYPDKVKWIELPAANMEQKTSTLVILDRTHNQLLVVVIDVTESNYLARDIMLI